MSEEHRHPESPEEPKGTSPETAAENRDAGSTFLLMMRGGHAYGLPIEAIHQINWLPMLNPEEALPPPVIGSFDMAGTIVPVVDLDCLHGDPPRPWRTTDCVVILENHQHFFALLVDEVYDVVEAEPAPAPWDFSDGETAPPSLLSGRIEADDRLVSVLDIEVLREAVRAGRPDCTLPELGTLLPADTDERALLEERAHTLMSGVDKEEVQAGRPHVVARLAGEALALPLSHVLEFAEPDPIYPIPLAPSHILGNANLRGEIVTIIDIREVLNLPLDGPPGHRAMVCERPDGRAAIALDEISTVIEILPETIRPLQTDDDSEGGASLVTGEYEHASEILTVIDLPALLQCSQLEVNKN